MMLPLITGCGKKGAQHIDREQHERMKGGLRQERRVGLATGMRISFPPLVSIGRQCTQPTVTRFLHLLRSENATKTPGAIIAAPHLCRPVDHGVLALRGYRLLVLASHRVHHLPRLFRRRGGQIAPRPQDKIGSKNKTEYHSPSRRLHTSGEFHDSGGGEVKASWASCASGS